MPAPVPRLAALAVGLALAGCAGAAGSSAAPGTTPAATSAAAAASALPSGGTAATATPSVPASGAASTPSSAPPPSRSPGGTPSVVPPAGRPLAGRVVVLDPGHQAGNASHPAQVNRVVDAGAGQRKACNTTGTETDGGYPESRVAWNVVVAAKARLEALGARVVLTRPREDRRLWGPCIDVRGRVGNRVGADAVVSVHADGAPAGDRGFHVIRPAGTKGWTDDIAAPSRVLGTRVHDALVAAGVRPARYIGSRDGYDLRADLGTLNWSDRPAVMVELGNMRDPADAALLTSPRWQADVAGAAIARGVTEFLAP